MNSCPKTKIFKSEKYKKYVRSLPCVICGYHGSEAHHIRDITNSGISKKPSDTWCIPLCRLHHLEFHQIGKKTFYTRHGIDIHKVLFETIKGFIEKEVT